MSVNNNYRFKPFKGDGTINIPIEIKWDFSGRDDDIERYEKTVIEEIIGSPGFFEISRYSHNEYGLTNKTSLNYEFYFYNSPTPVSASTSSSDWVNSYITNLSNPSGFSPSQVYYFQRPFRNSFFKLDFYDTPNTTTQKNYFTIILPTQQGLTESATISTAIPSVLIKKPSMILDFVGDKEGFFIYWLRSPDFVNNINTFYMSVKFFDARLGVFVRMMNEPQSSLPNKFIFDTNRYFFNKVVINYQTKKYEMFNYLNTRIGDGTPIKWYEYINP